MWNVQKTVFIDRRVAEVHCFATNPTHWYQWYAGLSTAENLNGNGGKGTCMDLKYSFFGRYWALHILVEENGVKDDGYVWRGEISGAFDATQTWRYLPKEGGTEIHFEMDYKLPGSIFGKMANTLYIESLMNLSVEETLQNLKEISERD
ncbi:MAG TPA: SRPBCC family protein [Planococcus sp. (in: firmicutes)]|nr:SRPBCC family protein [Planococcus sp. (in: firmicutes)]